MYPELSRVKEIREAKKDDHTLFDGVTDDVMREIFAPDPITGFPRSDLALMLSKDTAPEISQYIRDNIMTGAGTQTASFGSDDDAANMALEMTKTRYESVRAYSDRLRSIVEKSYEANKD